MVEDRLAEHLRSSTASPRESSKSECGGLAQIEDQRSNRTRRRRKSSFRGTNALDTRVSVREYEGLSLQIELGNRQLF